MHDPYRGEDLIYVVNSGSNLANQYSGQTENLQYVFNQLVVNGATNTTSTFTLNGQSMTLAGGTVLYHNIRTLAVTSGNAVTVIGYRYSTVLFG